MNALIRPVARTLVASVRAMAVFTVLSGIAYTLVITGIGQVFLGDRANGSFVEDATGQVVGSSLIGQSFADAEGNPLPQYFQPRPSAAGDGYDGGASSGSNQGPENEDLVAAIQARREQVAEFNGVSPDEVPADAVTASASGLDPDISPEYALLQADRIARERSLPVDQVRGLVESHTQGRVLGFLGEPTVNVLELNLALDELEG